MKLLVFGASSSRQSINRMLAVHAANRLRTEFLADADRTGERAQERRCLLPIPREQFGPLVRERPRFDRS